MQEITTAEVEQCVHSLKDIIRGYNPNRKKLSDQSKEMIRGNYTLLQFTDTEGLEIIQKMVYTEDQN